ncbi:MAG: bifunctional precorrin-2 dehydrogenase/sirohydrochlorin ferrochelatase [Clostridia bacterium]
MISNKSDVFPLFLNIRNKKILVVGSGKVATRRIETLLQFNCNIIVVSPTKIAENLCDKVDFINTKFSDEHIENCDLVIAATNERAVNHNIYILCKNSGILVNVCDEPNECDFYFPAIFQDQTIVGGLVSKEGNAHRLVKQTAEKIRGVL